MEHRRLEAMVFRFIDVYWSTVEERMCVFLCLLLAVLLSANSLACPTMQEALNTGMMAGWVIVEKTG